MQIEIPVWCGS